MGLFCVDSVAGCGNILVNVLQTPKSLTNTKKTMSKENFYQSATTEVIKDIQNNPDANKATIKIKSNNASTAWMNVKPEVLDEIHSILARNE